MKYNIKYNLKFEEKEVKKNQWIGWATSFSIHAVIIALLLIPACNQVTKTPGYPLPGMEINIGFVDAGSGDIQTSSINESEQVPTEPVEPEEVTEEAIVNAEKLDNPVESPHEVKTSESKDVKKTEPAKEKKEVVDSKNTYNSNNKSNSDGNTNKVGDQGKEHGNPDSRNMYDGKGKNPGDGGPVGIGASMDLPGWEWDSRPNKVDPTSENGYVLFEFFVDEDGTVLTVNKLQSSNLTATEENFYKKQLQATSFHLKDSRARPAPKTRGVFRFEVRTK